MDDKRKSFYGLKLRSREQGNAMVYVLIVVALFGALSFVLARQTDTTESNVVGEEQVEIFAGLLQNAPMQLKQSVEQMTFTGTQVSNLDFTTPDDPTFDAGSHVDKVFHPAGGGVVLPRIPSEAINEIAADPPARWYIGRFNNMEWTPTAADDVILTAHQITEQVCARINEKLTGSTAIPEVTAPVNEILIDAAESSAGANIEFSSANCAACFGQQSLCVKDDGVNAWSFYSLIAGE